MHCMNLFGCHPRETLYCHIPSIGNGEAAFAAITLLTTPHCVNVELRTIIIIIILILFLYSMFGCLISKGS